MAMDTFYYILVIFLGAACFVFIVISVACIFVLRRRNRNVWQRPGLKYMLSRTGSSNDSANAPELKLDDFPFGKMLTGQSVSWAEPLTQTEPSISKRRDRAVSCPEQTQKLSQESGSDDSPIRSPKSRARGESVKSKRKLRRKAKSDVTCNTCQVQFVVFYNFYHSILFLKLVCAVNIPSHFGATYGSYMKAELVPGTEKAGTKTQYHSNNPVFEESFEFPEISSDELLTRSLKVKLFTIDRFSHSSLVGVALVPFAELEIYPEHPTTVWRSLSPHESQFSPVPLDGDVFDHGALYLSLRFQILHNRLTVVIMKATNLPQHSKIFAIDPYVVVDLRLHFKTLQTRKTSLKRRTASPCWNEPLVFELDAKIPVSEYSLSVKVRSSNSLCEDITLGEVEIGYHAEGLGNQHWKEMIVKKNQDRAMCHKLH